MFTLLGGPNALIKKREKKERETDNNVRSYSSWTQDTISKLLLVYRFVGATRSISLSPPLSFGHDSFALIRVRFQRGFVANVIIYKF